MQLPSKGCCGGSLLSMALDFKYNASVDEGGHESCTQLSALSLAQTCPWHEPISSATLSRDPRESFEIGRAHV